MGKKYVYLFIRQDLSNPQKVVQSVHSAIEMARFQMTDQDEVPSVVAIGVKSELHLEKEYQRLLGIGIKIFPFYEPMFNNEFTSFMTVPLEGKDREPLLKYSLLRC